MLRQFLLLLPSQAILAIAPMLGQIRSASVQRQLMQIIAILARRNLRPLEQLLDQPEEFMAKKLIVVLGHLKGERPTDLLLKMVQHPSESVRRQVARQLLARGDDFLKRMLPLIEDPGDSVRTLILDHLGSKRSRLAEEFLLDYLDQARFKVLDHRHLLSCFEALGRCGSCQSIPFLQRSLFNRGWIPDLGRSIHRKGAVVALVSLGTEEAMALLHKASRSLLPGVRLAYRRALEAN
jgi:HEAT repeat protein